MHRAEDQLEKERHASAEKIASDLRVSPAEARALKFWAIAPKQVREEIKAANVEAVQTREQARRLLNAEIRDLLLRGWRPNHVAKFLGASRQLVNLRKRELKAEGAMPAKPRPVKPTSQAEQVAFRGIR